MAYVNKQNLSDFWTNAKRYIAARDADQCDWTSIPVNASSYQFEAEPRTPVNPVVEFGFTETLPAEGEKSPTNPSTIAGVDSVTVTKCGKNLCPLIGESSSSYISVSFTDNGEFVFNGSYAGLADVYVFNKTCDINLFPSYLERGKTYTFSLQGDNSSVKFNVFRYYTANYGGAVVSIAPGESRTYTIPDTQSMILRFSIPANTVLNNAKFKMQIEEGSTATSFEPYSGTTATVSLGETRYGGTLDVATGKMTVTHFGVVFDGTETLITDSSHTGTYYHYSFSLSNTASSVMTFATRTCSHFQFVNNVDQNILHFACTQGSIHLFVTQASSDDLKSWFATQHSAGTPVTFVYKLATPLVIDLDPQQLFSALSNSKVNTVFTDTGTIAQLTYAKPVPTEADVARFANWQKTETAGAVICAPVPESVLHPTVNFSFTEVPPESGDKSPSNPSTITGVTQVKAARCGKNIIPFPYRHTSRTADGITWTVNDDKSITANGTATASAIFIVWAGGVMETPRGVTYTLSGCPSTGSYDTYYIQCGDAFFDVGAGRTFSFSSNHAQYMQIVIKNGVTVDNVVFKPQLELGSTTTAFEPYSGADYIVNLNGTFYGGSIDLSSGLMTVTKANTRITSFNSFWSANTNTIAVAGALDYLSAFNLNCVSNKFSVIGNNEDSEHCRLTGTLDGSRAVVFWILKSRLDVSNAADPSNPTSAEWLAAANVWVSSNPIDFFSELYTPFTVQLTPQQIKALPALDRHEPRINTLYTDADSIQVSYQKSPIQIELELTDAILALGGGE